MRYFSLSLALLFAIPASVLGQDAKEQSEDRELFAQFLMLEPDFATQDPPVQSDALTLDDLLAIALQNNPTLVSASAQVRAARGQQIQAGLYPNPEIGYHATEVGNLGTAGAQGGFVRQRFITGGKRNLDRAIAGKQVHESQFHLATQQQRVLNDVRVRFYDALVAERRVDLTNELAEIGDQLVVATNKLKVGRHATENDLLQAEIQADQSLILLDNARNELQESWRRLISVSGATGLQIAPLHGVLESDLPKLDWESSYQLVLNCNPELSAARTRVDRARIVIRRAKQEPIPDVDVFVSARHQNVTGSEVANIIVGIPVPVFDDNRGNIHSAQADWIAACNDVKRIELRLHDQLAIAFRRYANARAQVDRYRDRIVPKAAKSLGLVTDGYEKGQVKYLNLLTSQRTNLEVNLAYLAALRELHVTTSIIEGQLLTGNLAGTRNAGQRMRAGIR